MQEIVIISGKGGTGKTSIAASLAALADGVVLADCDVDAADLHLILAPEVKRREAFRSGHRAAIRQSDCAQCGQCATLCRFDAVRHLERRNGAAYAINPTACEGCGVCVQFCPQQAIDFPEQICGEWMISDTRFGPMVHARLGIAAENSGKLVSVVRSEAREVAQRRGYKAVLIDGAPGVGCPVIASLTGASMALVVTEPTVSGEHDLERVLQLTQHFGIPAAVSVNKWDLNPSMTERIEHTARAHGAAVASRIRYDPAVTAAQVGARAVVEGDSAAAEDVRELWRSVANIGEKHGVQL
jgi:MinD superfamily P-loop ATPase